MTIDEKNRDEKLQYDINREAAKISALSYGKYQHYHILQVKKILSFSQRQIIEQAKFAYSPLEKAFEKQTEKQVDTITSLDISNKKDELKQVESIFLQNLMNDLIDA